MNMERNFFLDLVTFILFFCFILSRVIFIPIRPDRSLVIARQTSKWSLTLIERGFWMLLESGGGPHLLDHLKTM